MRNASLVDRVKRSEYFKDKNPVFVERIDQVKMSEVIIDFSEPLLNECRNFEEEKKALSLAMFVWNLSLIPKRKQAKSIKEICSETLSLDKDEMKDFMETIKFLLNRKKEFFNNNSRFIMDYQISPNHESFHLNVASTINHL